MVFSTQKERIHTLLKDTITLLCKNGLSFDSEFSIEALIGITLDKQDVFLVNINEIIRSEAAEKQAALDRELEQKQKTRVQSYESSDSASSESESLNRKRRKRKKNHDVKTERPDSGDDNDSNAEDHFCSSREHADLNNGSELQNKEKAVRNPSQTKGAMLPHGSIKRDMEEEDSMDDIIVIKEEVGEDWSQFCESNNFPSTSDPQNSQMSHTFPSATSTFTQSGMENSSFDWSSMATQGQFPPNPSASGNEASQPGGDSSQQINLNRYQCGICGKVVCSNSYLQVHMRRHDGQYRYHCPTCNKGFSSTYMLKGHMSWHTGVKEYKCNFCDKEFRYNHQLKQHVTTRHPSL